MIIKRTRNNYRQRERNSDDNRYYDDDADCGNDDNHKDEKNIIQIMQAYINSTNIFIIIIYI